MTLYSSHHPTRKYKNVKDINNDDLNKDDMITYLLNLLQLIHLTSLLNSWDKSSQLLYSSFRTNVLRVLIRNTFCCFWNNINKKTYNYKFQKNSRLSHT